MKTLTVSTHTNDEIIDMTDLIEQELKETKKKEGVCTIFVQHTTCALATADLDPGTDKDFLNFLRAIVPDLKFRHPHDPEHTPDHILSSIIGSSLSMPFKNGRLLLGTWQRIVLIELNGPRQRDVSFVTASSD